jgi:hypothetical protein
MRDMFPLTRIIITTITAAASILGIAGSALDGDSDPSSEGIDSNAAVITVHDGADPRWLPSVESAVARFEAADLTPVVADVHVWAATDADVVCHSNAGWFSVANESARVDLCIDFHDSDLGALLRDKLMLHELAHAWIHLNVDQTVRSEFMHLRGAEGWNDPELTHTSRGTEMAANTVMFALHPGGPSSTRQLCGYELLTGSITPNGGIDECAEGSASLTTAPDDIDTLL